MSIIFNSADIAETMNNCVSNVTGADSTITENYTNVVQHGIKIDMSVSEHTISGTPPLTFNSNGTPLIDYTIYGNAVQDGTPTPDNPVAVNGVGTLLSGNYVISISTNTVLNINLNSVPTLRKIKKYELTGNETFYKDSEKADSWRFYSEPVVQAAMNVGVCSHFEYIGTAGVTSSENIGYSLFSASQFGCRCPKSIANTVPEFKSWLATQYANGTPVTIWYVLATPETSTVNEPLMKIGNYADSVSYSQAGVTIPTVSGNNTLDIQTTPKPSNISITYKGR